MLIMTAYAMSTAMLLQKFMTHGLCIHSVLWDGVNYFIHFIYALTNINNSGVKCLLLSRFVKNQDVEYTCGMWRGVAECAQDTHGVIQANLVTKTIQL